MMDRDALRDAVRFRAIQARGAEASLRFWMQAAQFNVSDPALLARMRRERFVEFCCEVVWYYDAMKDFSAAVRA